MSKDKILLFGKNGQLGSVLFRKMNQYNLSAFDYPEIDFNQPESVEDLVLSIKPALIINAAAYTEVDQAEKEREKTYFINGHSVEAISKSAKKLGASLIHYSTDYVFDGEKGDLYQENDRPNPINVYGESKLIGETKIIGNGSPYLIFRLSWVYSLTHPSFVNKVLNLGRNHELLRIVDDQISNPTWADMVASMTLEIVNRGKEAWADYFQQYLGVYHLTGKGAVSRFEWAKTILDLDPRKAEQISKEILPAKSDDFYTPARRPKFSGMDCSKFEKTFNLELPDWKTSLAIAMSEEK